MAITVTSAPGKTGKATSKVSECDPTLFLWNGRYAVAQHADYSVVGWPELFPELATTPARPGETILLYGTGFGATAPAAGVGELARRASPLPVLPMVSIGGVPAVVQYAGIPQGGAGLYQVNVRVPESIADGDQPVSLVYGQVESPVAYIPVRR